jgi:hypothetical protein
VAPRALLCTSLLSATLACGVTEGPLLLRDDSEEPAVSADGGIASDMRLQYQITGTPQLDTAADWFVLDLFDADSAQLAMLRARGQVAVAYFSAGSLEPWRPDADAFPEAAIGSALTGYPNERWLDVRDTAVRTRMVARLALARDKGFRGVFPGALGAHRSDSGFPLTQSDQLEYDRFLASEALELGLTPGLSGDFQLGDQLVDAYDWALASGCLAAGSCERLRPFLDRLKPVFDLEVSGERAELCAQATELGMGVVMKQQSVDVWSQICP